MNTKEEIRRWILARRRELDAGWIEGKSRSIYHRVASLSKFRDAEVVCCYLAMPGEVNTADIITMCWKQAKKVCVPAFRQDIGCYELVGFERETPVGKGPADVPEPAGKDWVRVEQIDFMIVPGLAFDMHCGRLGHGGGHYDRIMAGDRAGTVLKVGLAFNFQVLDAIPMDRHDVWLDMVITENRMIRSTDAAGA